jgi:stage III sporulation protein AH
VGIYVNWTYTENQETAMLTDTLDAEKVLSEETLILEQESVDTAQTTASDYFAAVRLSRQEARDSAVSLLQEAMAYTEDAESSASNAQLDNIVQTALCEAQIESLVIAKGYADCVAYIGEDGISVAVAAPEGVLQQADVAVIADIVMTQSSFKIDKIRVVEVM